MKVSVIVCTYNRADVLVAALRSLSRLKLPPDLTWEILVVDNNSKDQTKSVVQSFCKEFPGRFRYLFEPQQGKSYALNAGIREARGEIIAFTDDDATVDPLWLLELICPIEQLGCAGTGGKIVPVWNFPKPDWIQLNGSHKSIPAIVHFDLGEERCPIQTAAFGANMAFRKEMFLRYGGFRPDLGPTVGSEIRGEDSEFCRRLIKAGESLIYVPTAIVYHPVDRKRIRKSYFKAWSLGRGRASMREAGCPPGTIRYFGVPRYLLSILVKTSLRWFFCLSSRPRFSYKLQVYETIGQIMESRKESTVRV